MESDDLKISSPKEAAKPVESEKESLPGAQDYMVEGAPLETQILTEIKQVKTVRPEEVIYGVYNNSNASWSARLNDFLIDHSKVKLKDKSYFFHMLAVMVDAGIPIVKSVRSLANRAENKRLRRILATVAHNAEGGANLSDAMSRFEEVFDESEVGIVKSGEATGRLHTMLFKLSERLDKRHDLYMKLWGAAIYPIAVLSVLILVAVGMLIWVLPTLINLLKEGGVAEDQLPFATRFLIGMQSGLINYWWAILIVIFAVYGMVNVYVKSSYGATKADYLKLKIPLVGNLLRRLYVLNFISMLGILIDAGLPVIKALSITGNALQNRIYKLKVQEVINQVHMGGKISESLSDTEFLFPGELTQMIAIGEQSASIGKVAEKISDQYQKEIDNTLKKLTSVFEPVMILVVGTFVAILALAIMAPIFNLSSTIH